ncbi:MAG: hypothetical protein R3279_00645 [Putridiphycobacter sp.]|nr:hypothetical protein [Putridiphycobacter sp.]
MKWIIICGALLLAGTTVIGQNNSEPYTFGVLKSPVSPNPNPVENTYRPTSKVDDRALNILWTEDYKKTKRMIVEK